MRLAKDLLDTPSKEIVIIEHRGERYLATEEDVRYLQLLVAKDLKHHTEYKILDINKEGLEYSLGLRIDGILEEDFTSNIYTFNSNLSFKLITNEENIKQNKQMVEGICKEAYS